ncbi:MAG: hypothetical protein BGO78_06800 [Chloroflexi bacterium 44-23]|nr:MAG: hypothetical protein BGO78_06800 [Chloroflexi bacterium 44-23]
MEQYLSENTKRLKIYIGESDLWRGKPLYFVILEILTQEGMAGATVTRGIAGFGARSRIHTAAILRISEDLPLIIEVVDTTEKITLVLEKIYPLVREGLMTVEDIQVLKYTHRYLNPLPVDRLAGEVMSRDVKLLTPKQTIRQAWELMLKQGTKAMPVVNSQGNVIGILTDEDLISRAGLNQRLSIARHFDTEMIKKELDALEQSHGLVEDVMSTPVFTTRSDAPIGQAVNLMKKHEIKRLPVVNEKEVLVGILSRFDILRLVVPSATKELPPLSVPGYVKKVGEIMSPVVPTVTEHDDIATVIHTMLENGSHRVIVVDQDKKVSGIMSDGDVFTRLPVPIRPSILSAFKRLDLDPITDVIARDLMSPNPITASPELPIATAIQKMMAEGRKWLVIIDEENHPVGLVDRQRLLDALAMIPPTIT